MSKRKGLSVEEKRKRLLEIFDSYEFFTMKEIEKLGSQKGEFDSPRNCQQYDQGNPRNAAGRWSSSI
jgi:hypothetical protein